MNTQAFSIEELKRLEQIMEAMVTEASHGNWQELNRLDSERRVLIGYQVDDGNSINQATNAAAPTTTLRNRTILDGIDTQADSYQDICYKLRQIDDQLNAMVNSARQQLIEQSRGIRAQVKAKKGYEQASKAL